MHIEVIKKVSKVSGGVKTSYKGGYPSGKSQILMGYFFS